MTIRPFLILVLLFTAVSARSQTDREFWFVAPDVFANNANFNIPIVVRITSFSAAANVTISLPADNSFTPIVVSIPANSTQTVDLTPWVNILQNAPPNTILNKGMLIQSDNDITAYYEVVSSYCNCNPEIFALKGKNALGNEFYISSQYTYDIDTIRHPPATTSFDIVATQDNTTVTITPSQAIVGHAPGVPFPIVLNKGQTYSATGIWRDKAHHLQGSVVTSDKPVAVTLKDDLVFGDGPGADLIGDQTVPTSVVGNEYIVSKGFLVPRDRVFVLAVEDNTPIFLDGSSSASILLNKGQSWTFDLSNNSTYIRSDKKFYVYHVTGLGDELGSAIIPKLNCTGSSSVNIVRSSNNTFGVMLVTQAGNQGNFTVNGNPGVISAGSFLPVPGTGGAYVAATIDLSGYLPAGSILRFVNTTGKFSLGMIDGNGTSGSRYGFFSDFKSSNVTNGQVTVCPHDSVQLYAFGGVTYEWSPTAGLSDPHISNPKASPGVSTKYKVIITNSDGCVDSAYTNVVLNSAPSAEFSFDQLTCNPLELHFQAAAYPGASYSWMVNSGTYTPGQLQSYIFPVAGTYPIKLKVTLANGCTDSITKTIPVLLQPAELINTADTPLCVGMSVPLSTKPALDFCWSPTTYLDNPVSANPVATPSSTTKYYFTAKVTSANLITNGDFTSGNTGFTSDYTYTTVNLGPAEYLVGKNPQMWNSGMTPCSDHTTGDGNMLLVNGSQQLNVNVWSQTITVQPNTDYAFSAWLQSISAPNPATLQFSINGQPLGSPLQADAVTCTWRQFYTTWNSGVGTQAVISIVNMNTAFSGNDFALDDISFSPLTMLRDSVTITVRDIPQVKAKPDTTVCPGSPVPLTASGADVYLWTPAVTLSDPSSSNPVATVNSATEYIVTGTTQGCSARDTIHVALFHPPSIRISSDTTICSGDPIRLHIEAGPGATYSWTPIAQLDDPASATPLGTLLSDDLFRVTITDANGCKEKDSVKVSIRPFPLFVQPLDAYACDGYSVILGRNNRKDYVYTWLPATDLDDPAAPRPVVTPTASREYIVVISDSSCPRYNKTFQVAVTLKPNPIVTVVKAHDIDCSQPTTQLDASGAITYNWRPSAGLSDPATANPIVAIDSTVTYIVKGTAANQCFAYDTITVNVKAIGPNTFIVPNAFTPNGDGHNDCYGIQRWGDVLLEEFSIYNRWGERVFFTRNPSGCWDGTFKGTPQPTGAYVYIIRAKSFCGPVFRTGTLTLLR